MKLQSRPPAAPVKPIQQVLQLVRLAGLPEELMNQITAVKFIAHYSAAAVEVTLANTNSYNKADEYVVKLLLAE